MADQMAEQMRLDEDEDQAVMAVLMDLMLDEDDEREEGDISEEVITVDIEGYRIMSNLSFKQNFRMDRIVFQRLVVEIGLHMRATNRIQREGRTDLDLCILMALWPIVNPDTFRSSGQHFGKRKGSIHFHYKYIIEVLREMAPRYVKWPDERERDQIQHEFEALYGYPGVVGCIDGVHIEITAPLEGKQGHINRHHDYSILVQAVCDHRQLYRDIYSGQPGSIGDVRNFDRSPLSRNLLTKPELLSEGEHLLGDGAYFCNNTLLTPYGDDGNLTARQLTHNALLSACRAMIENSFARLKGKMRRLKKLHMRNVQYLNDHIIASMVLHNFIILEGNDSEGLAPTDPVHVDDEEFQRLSDESRTAGLIKREYIAHVLHPNED